MGVLDRAVRFIDDVLLLPEELRATLDEADAKIEAGDGGAAARTFMTILAARPQLGRAQVGLARARESLGDVRGAREAIGWARAADPDDPTVAILAARLALRANELEEAAVAARDAQRRLIEEGGPRLAVASLLRGEAEARRGRPDRAARELRKALAAEDTVATRVRLVEVLVAAGREATARSIAAQLAPATVTEADAARLGRALATSAPETAEPFLRRAAAGGDAASLVALAARARTLGQLGEAEDLARRAVVRGGGVEALVALAEVRLAQGEGREAAEAFAAAAAQRPGDADLARAAVRAAPIDDAASLTAHAGVLATRSPDDAAALAGYALAALAREGKEERRPGSEPSSLPSHPSSLSSDPSSLPLLPATSSEPRVQLARALLALRERDAASALSALDAFARTPSALRTMQDAEHAERLRREALVLSFRDASGEVDLAGATEAIVRFAASREPRLVEVEEKARRVRETLDAPLSLAILGEFNAGKSTLVNAFVGADVAPTGVVPTTATLNVLRHGAERRVRVVRRDGSTREGGFDDLRRFLLEAAKEGPGATDHVEILVPSDALVPVWIVDAPGTNALDPAHELVAREALERADAVLWVFSAGQAGKESERRTLEAIRASRRLVVPVINKADRLSPDELAAVRALLARELPDLGLVPLAVSARDARQAQATGDSAALAQSGFPALLEVLERDVFARSRLLKRKASAQRLVMLLDAALTEEPAQLAVRAAREKELAGLAAPIARLATRAAIGVDDALAAHSQAEKRALAAAAAEVVSFLQPRTNRFTRHGVDREDRAFLADVIDRERRRALDGLARGLADRIAALFAEVAPELSAELAARPGALDVAAALDRPMRDYAAHGRGFLAGGALERVVADLTKLDPLTVEAVEKTLARLTLDPRELLRPGLLDAASDLVQELDRFRSAEASRLASERDALATRTYAPLRALREALSGLF